jgi:hypothetical protein
MSWMTLVVSLVVAGVVSPLVPLHAPAKSTNPRRTKRAMRLLPVISLLAPLSCTFWPYCQISSRL